MNCKLDKEFINFHIFSEYHIREIYRSNEVLRNCERVYIIA